MTCSNLHKYGKFSVALLVLLVVHIPHTWLWITDTALVIFVLRNCKLLNKKFLKLKIGRIRTPKDKTCLVSFTNCEVLYLILWECRSSNGCQPYLPHVLRIITSLVEWGYADKMTCWRWGVLLKFVKISATDPFQRVRPTFRQWTGHFG